MYWFMNKFVHCIICNESINYIDNPSFTCVSREYYIFSNLYHRQYKILELINLGLVSKLVQRWALVPLPAIDSCSIMFQKLTFLMSA